MKSIKFLVLIISVLVISVWSCKPKEVITEGKNEVVEVEKEKDEVKKDVDCKYDILEGKGKITRMNFSNPDNIVINFEFTPPKSSGLEQTQGHLFNVNNIGKYPTRDWCDKNGIEQGAVFPVHQYTLVSGAEEECEKVKFSFFQFEGSSWK